MAEDSSNRPQPRKVMITCAVTGAIHTPSMSPHLPITPEEIAEAAVAAAEAGAALVHLHARNPETGRPDQSAEAFGKFLPKVNAEAAPSSSASADSSCRQVGFEARP